MQMAIEVEGVKILGPTNLAAQLPNHASQMFSRNVSTFLLHLTKDGALHMDRQDEITAGTVVTHAGQVVHSRLRDLLGMPAAPSHSGGAES